MGIGGDYNGQLESARASLGIAVKQWGLHSLHVHHSMVLMALGLDHSLRSAGPTDISPPRVCFLGSPVCLWPTGPTPAHQIWLSHHTELICPAGTQLPLPADPLPLSRLLARSGRGLPSSLFELSL